MIAISILDLAAAYRKVKVDLFYSGNPCRFALAEFEIKLEENLDSIKKELEQNNWDYLGSLCKGYWLCPKKIEFEPDDNKPIYSNPEKTFTSSEIKSCELRLIANVPIAFHVITTLWIHKVGEKFDLLLSENSYGNRIRRHKDHTPNLNAIGTFNPYLYNYQAWRDNGLKTIRDNLELDKDVIAITADFTAFYHNVNSDFIKEDDFQKELGIELSDDEKDFTCLIVKMMNTWAQNTPLKKGLPVGCSISAVIANMALAPFDRCIETELVPLYYGRYVDDIIIVMENTNHFSSSEAVWDWIKERVTCLKSENVDGEKQIIFSQSLSASNSQNKSRNKLFFERNKTKIFLLEAQSGLAFLETLERQIKIRSSEWRSLPELPGDEYIASMLLAACNKSGEEADNLRKADSLSIRRAMFAMKLRDFESYCRNLDPICWQKQRHTFLDTIDKYFTNLQCFFDLFRYFPRIISIATECKDFDFISSITKKLIQNCTIVQEYSLKDETTENYSFKISSQNITIDEKREISNLLSEYIKLGLQESFVATLSCSHDTDDADFASCCSKIIPTLSLENVYKKHNELVGFDLAYKPLRYISFHKEMNWGHDDKISAVVRMHKQSPNFTEKGDFDTLLDFARKSITGLVKDFIPQAWLFPTRPFNMSELYFIHENPFESSDSIAEILRIMRGYAKNLKGMPKAQKGQRILEVANFNETPRIRIALTSWKTEDDSWNAAACRKTDPDQGRYSRLTHLLNQLLKTHGRLDYVVFPELSIPPRWFLGLALKLKTSGISLISGVEYVHHKDDTVSNQVWASLMHDGLGFRESIIIRHDKDFPAIHEGNELTHVAGKKLKPEIPERTCDIIKHGNFYFGILICSELTNINYRAKFRGVVDAIFVPEWNSDIEMFVSLIEAAAYDVHAYIIQCNNRKYGDTRIRIPAKRHFERDIVKIKGGEEDYFVIGQIDIQRLRQFQSFEVSPTGDSALFKPVPAGFEIAPYRKMLPKE